VLYLLFFIVLITLLILYLYFSENTPKNRFTSPNDDTIHETNPIKKKETQKRPEKVNRERTLPFRTNKPFTETENIKTDDFIVFKGAKILFVEDNVINQKILLSTLKKSGISICIANHGEEALEILFEKKKVFDLILMDISMPVMDGYTTTQKIREDHRFDILPIVTFTAFTQGSEIHKMFDLGANGHITKPLNIAQLYTVFATYLPGIKREVSSIERLNINGLDIRHGIIMENGDEAAYRQSLYEFLLLYKGMVDTMPYWIDHHKSERIMATCSQMGKRLKHIGAYDLAAIVFRMKKIYIYNTEHRIEEFREIFPQKLQILIQSIEGYLHKS